MDTFHLLLGVALVLALGYGLDQRRRLSAALASARRWRARTERAGRSQDALREECGALRRGMDEALEAERDAALAQVAALREALEPCSVAAMQRAGIGEPGQDQYVAHQAAYLAAQTLADTASAAAARDQRILAEERERIVDAIRRWSDGQRLIAAYKTEDDAPASAEMHRLEAMMGERYVRAIRALEER